MLPQNIFREYDIRGIYPTELNEENAELIGKAFGKILRARNIHKVVVGRDDRSSSISLSNSFVSGLVFSGCDVIDTGITVEPAIHYFTFLPHIDAAVNITASHNPRIYNGIKIDLAKATPYFGKDLQRLYTLCVEDHFEEHREGSYVFKDLNKVYIDYIASLFKLKNRPRVVVYCGNGATSEIYPKILNKIGANVLPIRCYYDSAFPEGVPDPESGDFVKEVAQLVRDSEASIGVGFDGDGDRVGDIDERGYPYKMDEIALLYADEVVKKNKGATILFDVKCSQVLADHVTKIGGKAKMLRTGRGYFLEEMLSGKAMFGVELSGHVYFKDEYLGYDDGIYATCRLLRILDQTGKKLSELMQGFPKRYSTSEIKITCDDNEKFKIVDSLKERVRHLSVYHKVSELDGIRVNVTKTGWFLIRASNTGAYLSARVEADSKKEVQRILGHMAELLSEYPSINFDV